MSVFDTSNKKRKFPSANAPQINKGRRAQKEMHKDWDVTLREIDPSGTYAMCCTICRCSDEKFSRCIEIRNNCGNSNYPLGNTSLYHRGCCHNDYKRLADYLSPIQRTIEKSYERLGIESKDIKAKPLSHIQSKYNTARMKETQRENEEYDVSIDSMLGTNPDYVENRRLFEKRKAKKSLNHPLIVLDLFSGMGSTCVVLKKLGLPLKRIVHVEHDPVAVEVCKFNHNSEKDGIEYVFFDTFEEIYGRGWTLNYRKVKNFVERYGPFDLVLAGAPCQNYAEVNAFRDRTKLNANYLPGVGTLIKAIDKIQLEKYNREDKVLFLSENVKFGKSDPVWPYYGDQDHGLCPVRLDAKDFSPCARNRFYWTNIPLRCIDSIKDVALHLAVPGQHLDEGFEMIETICMTETEREFMTVKANTSMACKFRIDDERMFKAKKKDGTYYVYPYSVREREIMAGLPISYISNAVHELFEKLTNFGFKEPEMTPGKCYKDCLDKSLWHFAEKCRFKFKTRDEDPFFQIQVSAPREGKKLISFYDEEEYCKRLIGNGWSIPVVEHLLKPIKDLFPNDFHFVSYDGYDYDYPWPPYTNKHSDEPEGDTRKQSFKVEST